MIAPFVLMTFAVAAAKSSQQTLVAVKCEVIRTNTNEEYGETPKIDTQQFSRIYILDDKNQRIMYFDERNNSMSDLCKDCNLSYGSRIISYWKNESGSKPYYQKTSEKFEINRETGKLAFNWHLTDSDSSVETRESGQCAKIPVPQLTSKSAIF